MKYSRYSGSNNIRSNFLSAVLFFSIILRIRMNIRSLFTMFVHSCYERVSPGLDCSSRIYFIEEDRRIQWKLLRWKGKQNYLDKSDGVLCLIKSTRLKNFSTLSDIFFNVSRIVAGNNPKKIFRSLKPREKNKSRSQPISS